MAATTSFFSSDGMIADGTKPGPVVAITNLSQSQNGIFHEDVTLQIDVEDPTVEILILVWKKSGIPSALQAM